MPKSSGKGTPAAKAKGTPKGTPMVRSKTPATGKRELKSRGGARVPQAEWEPPSAPSLSVPLASLGVNPQATPRKNEDPTPRQQPAPAAPTATAAAAAQSAAVTAPAPARDAARWQRLGAVPFGILVDERESSVGYVRNYVRKSKEFDLLTVQLYSSAVRTGMRLETAEEGLAPPDTYLGREVWEITHGEARELAATSPSLRDFWGLAMENYGLEVDPEVVQPNKRDSLIEFGPRHVAYDLGPAPRHLGEETSRVADYFLNVYLDLSHTTDGVENVFTQVPLTPDPQLVGKRFMNEKHLIETISLEVVDAAQGGLPNETRLTVLDAYYKDMGVAEQQLMALMDGLFEFRITEAEIKEIHAVLGILGMCMERMSTYKAKHAARCRPDGLRKDHVDFINEAIKGVDVEVAADASGVTRPHTIDLYHIVPIPPSIFRIYVQFFVTRRRDEDALEEARGEQMEGDAATQFPKETALMLGPAGRKMGTRYFEAGEDNWEWGFDWWASAGYVVAIWWRDHVRFCSCIHHLVAELKMFVLGDEHGGGGVQSKGPLLGCLCRFCGEFTTNLRDHLTSVHQDGWKELVGHGFSATELAWEVWRTRYLERIRYESVVVFKYMRWVRRLWNALLVGEVAFLKEIWTRNHTARRAMECWDFSTKPVRMGRFKGIDVRQWTGRILRIDLTGFGVSHLPNEIRPVKYLRELHVSNNYLSQLPSTLCHLPFLEAIHAENNRLKTFPPNLHKIASLKSLSLLRNHISQIPKSLGESPGLLFLNLCQNVITDIPPELEQLHQSLKYFLILDNQNVLKEDISEEEKRKMDFLVQTYTGGNTVMSRDVPPLLQPALMESVQFFRSPIFRGGLHKGPWTYRFDFMVLR